MQHAATGTTSGPKQVNGGRFDFDDGGTYCGGWEDGKAHGHGVCTGPKGQGEYSGSWHFGFEVSGVYTWPSGSTFEGHWQNGKRHGLGVETRGRWIYRGEWTQGFKGRYGIRQSTTSNARYEGTWANGLQDGYGSETYADGGTYQGQWMRGMRHGYGVRTSAPFGLASHLRPKNLRASLTSLRSDAAVDPAAERDKKMDDGRGGFVLKARSDEVPVRRRSLVEKSTNLKKSILQGLRIRKQRSTSELEKRGTSGSIRSTGSTSSWVSTESSQSGMTNTSMHTDSNASFVVEDEMLDANVTETYMGEWKNDKRCGFGISERSDGLKYEGEWYNNKKYGYGVTTLKDGTREEGKYKNNVLITSQKKKHLFLIRSAKFRERIDSAVNAAQRASKIALQKADIAISRTATARGKGEQADIAAMHAREDSDIARLCAKQFAPDFHQPADTRFASHTSAAIMKMLVEGTDNIKAQLAARGGQADISKLGPLKKPEENSPHIRSKSMYVNQKPRDSEVGSRNNTTSPGSYESDAGLNPQPPGVEVEIQRPNLAQVGVGSGLTSVQQGSMPVPDSLHLRGGILPQTYTNRIGPGESAVQPNRVPPSQTNYLNPNRISELERQVGKGPTMPESMVRPQLQTELERGRTPVRGSSIQRGTKLSFRDDPTATPPGYSFQQAMNDHFDHYKRPPSRDSSVDRFSRTSRGTIPREIINPHQRAPSRQRTPYGTDWTPDSGVSETMSNVDDSPTHAGDIRRTNMPNFFGAPEVPGNEAVLNSESGGGGGGGYTVPNSPLEEMVIRQRGLGQEIPPAANTPKRTESMYISPVTRRQPQAKNAPAPTQLKRKKSLPDVQGLPKATAVMSREEVSALSSMRREEVRRMAEEAERLRANPLLYLFNPNVKDWFSRQQLMMLVLFINISLAIMFFKLLT